MALPDAPNTRKEQYLNAIATGSGKPDQPYTREEMYLDYIADNGSGGGGGGSGGGGVLVVNVTEVDDIQTCDKTAGEMWAACQTGCVIFRIEPYEGVVVVAPLQVAYFDSERGYSFEANSVSVSADTENDYPSSGSIN